LEMIVCIKQVPNTTEVQMDIKTKTLMREGVASIVNPFDLIALEEALRIKKEMGGNITVLSMGPPQAISALQECRARGADRAILITDKVLAGSDTLATSFTLSSVITTLKTPFDIIFCGLQAIDGDTGQVGPGIAEFLNLPVLPNAIKVIPDMNRKSVMVHRKTEEGIEVLRVAMPVLVIADRYLAKPAFLTNEQMERMSENPIEIISFKNLGGEEADYGLQGSATEVIWIGTPKPIGHMVIDPNLHYQERIRLTLSGGLEAKSKKYILKNEPPEKAVKDLIQKLLEDEILSEQK